MKKEEKQEEQDYPAVIAYRLGRVEKEISSIGKKLDVLREFVTYEQAEKMIKRERERADLIHKEMRDQIDAVSRETEELKKFKDNMIGRLALGGVMILVAMILTVYGLEKFIGVI